MLRLSMFLVLAVILGVTLSGCIVVDGHHHGNIPPGHLKKMNR